MKVDLSSGTIGYVDQGRGSAVLLIHAFPLNRSMWTPQIEAFSARFRVIAPDIRGFGESQPASAWSMEDMADTLDELLSKLNIESCSVAGVSIGGYIAFAFWARHRNRVRQLIISNSRARADNETEKSARNEMIAAIQQNGAGILADRMLTRLLQPNPAPSAVQAVRQMIDQANAQAAAYAVMAMRDRMDFSSILHRIDCPTLVVTGENDVIIRVDDSHAVADAISGAQFVTIANSGHLSNQENPEAFNAALLSFLR